MASSSAEAASKDTPERSTTVEAAVEKGQRAFALKKYEQAVDHYATALELLTDVHGDEAPGIEDLYFAYGKALLENAIVQNSVLGKEQPEENVEDNAPGGSGSSAKGPILSFSGDVEDTEDGTVDLFAQAMESAQQEAAAAEDDEDEDAEPEDDFNASWEVLDLARAIYEKQKAAGGDEQVGLKLADTYITLGDVSLETEKFDQAITDYESALALKVELLPFSSRQIAEAHYKLSIVLDLTSGRLADSIIHAEKALESLESRLAELQAALPNSSALPPPAQQDPKGKGKAKSVSEDAVERLTTNQIENEIKELKGLKDDLVLKIEELKTSPNESVTESAPAMVAHALDKELNAGSAVVPNQEPVVNDLTSMVVKKKKKAPEDTSAVKRKAEDDAQDSNCEKKPKVDSS
ncbi:uncharacterized protein EV420DRAFT_670911 [Desarmillaria tabescens]|uniref:Tetratricopeptide SHNi-TPR domain-containing protein n=1 Tax=Armillaria tabescens TaxID=1929756 RepID=A0AA39NKB2_ARMTA|nr:uncharacterized protein EV420DRAFT_670911 [Desarmillaria tabescens]KAK0467181.1 hypothetical protein EV420DRAFT_670911 [Desarmillaria tabescens]